VAAGLLFGVGAVQAALQPYTSDGKNLVYSTEQNLTWTADANLFRTQYLADTTIINQIKSAVPSVDGHTVVDGDFDSSNGRMTGYGAMAWVQWLGTISYGGFNDWRLPDVLDAQCAGLGQTCPDGEFGYFWYNEGQLTDPPQAINTDPPGILGNYFVNLQSHIYWVLPVTDGVAIIFNTNADFGGWYDSQSLEKMNNAWAVRSGQITPPTPIPTLSEWAQILLALSLMGMAGWYWQRRSS
jgi:hypothetical protein